MSQRSDLEYNEEPKDLQLRLMQNSVILRTRVLLDCPFIKPWNLIHIYF
jgi:hypothetical protein